jgi:hypothetical protein
MKTLMRNRRRQHFKETQKMVDSLRAAQNAQRPQMMRWEKMRRLRRYETSQYDEGLTRKLAGLLSTQISKSSGDRRARSLPAGDRGGGFPHQQHLDQRYRCFPRTTAPQARQRTWREATLPKGDDALGVNARTARRQTNSYLAYLVFEKPTAMNLLDFVKKQDWLLFFLPTTRFTAAVSIIAGMK